MENPIITIHQPHIWPSLYLVNRFLRADVHVIFDEAQVTRETGQFKINFRVPGRDALIQSYIIPALGGRRVLLKQCFFELGYWDRKVIRTIEVLCRNAPYKTLAIQFFEESLRAFNGEKLVPASSYAMVILSMLKDLFGCGPSQIVLSSSLPIDYKGMDGNQKVRAVIAHFNGKFFHGVPSTKFKYLCGGGSCDYLDIEALDREGVRVEIQDWKCPNYCDVSMDDNLALLSVLDLLCCHWKDGVKFLI